MMKVVGNIYQVGFEKWKCVCVYSASYINLQLKYTNMGHKNYQYYFVCVVLIKDLILTRESKIY